MVASKQSCCDERSLKMRSKLAGFVAVGILAGVTHSPSAAVHWYPETFVYFDV